MYTLCCHILVVSALFDGFVFLVQANALRQHRQTAGRNHSNEAGLKTADITGGLDLVEKYKFGGVPSIEHLRNAAKEYYANRKHDDQKGRPTKSGSGHKQNPFGDLRAYVSTIVFMK